MSNTTLVKASGKTVMTTAVMTLVGFVSSVITARMLGPEGRGLLSAALMIATLAASISQCGLASSYIYYYGASRSFRYLRYFVLSLAFVCGMAMLLVWAGMQLSHESKLHEQLLLLMVTALFMSSQMYFFSLSQLQADLHFFNSMRFWLVFGNLILLLPLIYAEQLMQTVLKVFGNLILLLPLIQVFHTVEYQHILATQMVVVISLTLAGLHWAKKYSIWQNKPTGLPVRAGEVVQYAFHQYGTVLLGIILLNFDKIILLRMGTIEQYGYYAMAFTTSRLIGAVQDAVSTALYARFAGKDVEELGNKVKIAFRLTFLPMLLLAAIGALLSPWLIVWVYGKSFSEMASPFAILLFECVIGGASWTLAQRFNAGGRPGLVFVRQFISVLPIFLAVPFLPHENTYLYLAVLMLIGALLRLGVTLALYPLSLKESIPRAIPTMQDFRTMRQWAIAKQMA